MSSGPGSLFKAVQRTGGLTPVINSLHDIWQKQSQRDYYNNLIDAWNKSKTAEEELGVNKLPVQRINNPLDAAPQVNISRGSESNSFVPLNKYNPLNVRQTNNQIDPFEGLAFNTQTGLPQTQGNDITMPKDMTMNLSRNINTMNRNNPLSVSPQNQTQENVVPVTGRQNIQQNFDQIQLLQNYNAAQKIISDFIAPNYIKALQEGIDPSIINPLAQLLRSGAEKYKPIQEQLIERDPSKSYYRINPQTGKQELIYEGQHKKDYSEKATIELTEAKDGYPAGTKVNITWDKNNPGDFKILGKAADTKTTKRIAQGRYHRIEAQR